MKHRTSLLLGAVALLSACRPTVGATCSDEEMAIAHTLVYDTTGSPAYAGQAYMLGSCAGGGTECHATRAIERYGAPWDLNFDPVLADDPSFPDEYTGANYLYQAQLRIHRNRDDIYGSVWDNSMPPGAIGREDTLPYFYADRVTQVPSLATAEGLELLRIWLACGTPVVEASGPRVEVACTVDEQCIVDRCDVPLGECVPVGDLVTPLP